MHIAVDTNDAYGGRCFLYEVGLEMLTVLGGVFYNSISRSSLASAPVSRHGRCLRSMISRRFSCIISKNPHRASKFRTEENQTSKSSSLNFLRVWTQNICVIACTVGYYFHTDSPNMAPRAVHSIRHVEGYHNSEDNENMPGPDLTPKGRKQREPLATIFPFFDRVDLVCASPIRRAIQTALISMEPYLQSGNHRILALPLAQEATDKPTNTPSDVNRLQDEFRDIVDFHRCMDTYLETRQMGARRRIVGSAHTGTSQVSTQSR